MLLPLLLIVIGFALLIKGADWLVSGASSLAKKFNISDLAIGLTIVAFGTSAPELVVNSLSSFQGYSDLVYGNIIGSNNFNLFIILGIVGIISPIAVQSSTVWKEIPISFLAIIVLYGLSNPFMGTEPVLSRFDGLILLILFISFLYYVYSQLKSDPIQGEAIIWQMSTKKIWLLIAIGLGGLVLGGRMVVVNAVDIATQLGVSEKIIGLTIVAAGTSLPELTTSVVAAFRRNSDIAIGNVIGSNIFNIFLILPISSLIHPIEFNPAFNTDMYILMIGTAFLFLAMFTGKLKKLDRWEAGLLLLTYLAYTAYLISVEAS